MEVLEQIADYVLVRQLGEGNYGQFYLAKPPPRLGLPIDQIALKVVAGATGNDAFHRATKELRLFASVKSEYLVDLFDAGQDGDYFFYSMEYFPRGSLGAPSAPLSRTEVRQAVANAARATHDLHESGIAHRDIKPENIMLDDDGGKLADLGLAQLLAPGLTITGMGPVQSVEFMDPNIMRGERASRASDIWSLGITLHRALTGRSVYGDLPADDPLLALRKVLNNEPAVDPSLSSAEASLIQHCLARDPADRPATALAVAEELEAIPAS